MATQSRKSVALLFLGGATIDERDRLGDSVSKPAHVKPWLRQMSEMDIIAETQGVYVASGVTTIGLAEWQETADAIKELYDDVDGFVVIHQLETLPAAAVALSLLLQKLGKPVVLCGSPLLSGIERANHQSKQKSTTSEFGAKASFINAVQVAVSDIAEVVVVYGSHIYRGRSIVGPMAQVSGDVIGKIDFGIRFFGEHEKRHDRALKLSAPFDQRLAMIEYLPGVDMSHAFTISRGTRAVFVSSPEGQGALTSAVTKLRQLVPTSLPIIVYQHHHANVPSGVFVIDGTSRATAVLRVMWALGQTDDPKKLQKLLS